MSYNYILVETEDRVGIVQLNRPNAYNALSPELMMELMEALEVFDRDEKIGCMIITGNEKAFAAGADIKFMAGDTTPVDMLRNAFIDQWDRLARIKKPVIAAVSGFVLGGGCELAMACDMIVASKTSKFGQPEINIGVIPGAGGTQRLTRIVGKAVAMEMILNGRILGADEALQFGLINRIAPVESYLSEAISLAAEISARAPLAVHLAKQAINASYEGSLKTGLDLERNLFFMLFSSEDQKEGMDAFINKRQAIWQGR
jgi:enoyl-CoA hydratase